MKKLTAEDHRSNQARLLLCIERLHHLMCILTQAFPHWSDFIKDARDAMGLINPLTVRLLQEARVQLPNEDWPTAIDSFNEAVARRMRYKKKIGSYDEWAIKDRSNLSVRLHGRIAKGFEEERAFLKGLPKGYSGEGGKWLALDCKAIDKSLLEAQNRLSYEFGLRHFEAPNPYPKAPNALRYR